MSLSYILPVTLCSIFFIHYIFFSLQYSQSPIRGTGITLRTCSALHLNISGALFIVLEDVLRLVKQTNTARAGTIKLYSSGINGMGGMGTSSGSNSNNNSASKSPLDRNNNKPYKVNSRGDLIDFIPIERNTLSIMEDETSMGISKGNNGSRGMTIDVDRDKDKVKDRDSDGDREFQLNHRRFQMARERKKSINQQFRMEWNEKDDGDYDQEISTKSESLTYASYARKRGARGVNRPASIALSTDTATGTDMT